MNKPQVASICAIILAVIFIITSLLILLLFPILTRDLIRKNVPLRNGSYSFSKWSSPDYSIRLNFWMFNVTNPDEILLRGAKPSLSRKGPYSFTETQDKVDIDGNVTSNTWTYRNVKRYVFNANKSCSTCSRHDVFIVPNVPYLTAVNMLNSMPNMTDFVKGIFHVTLLAMGEHPFTSQTADSLLFNGYKDALFSLLQWLKYLPQFQNVPDRMGFFYPKNNSDDGLFEIESGMSAVENLGLIRKYNGNPNLDIWLSSQCNAIRGSDGTVFPPFLDKSSILRMFIPDICRSIFATFYSEITLDKLKLYRFIVPQQVFDAKNLDNEGFCQPTDQVFYPNAQPPFGNTSLVCLPSGLLNLTKCKFGAPVVVSNHNFMGASAEVFRSVSGLSDVNVQNDASFLDIEPNTGVLVRVNRRLQLNVAVYNIGRVMKYLKPVIIPVLMLNESAVASKSVKDYLYKSFVLGPTLAHGFAYTLLTVGLLALLVFSLILIRLRRHKTIGKEVDESVSEIEPQSTTTSATDLS